MPVFDRIRHLFVPWGRRLLNVMYPNVCRACRAVPLGEDRPWLCSRCADELALVEAPYCSVCAEPFDGAIDRTFQCSNCADRTLHFDFAFARHRAEGAARDLIHRFKYNGELSLRGLLTDMLNDAFAEPRLAGENLGDWLLVPVPLHHRRRRERGFNQAWQLCQCLSKLRGIPACDAMRRTRDTGHQADLTRLQRLENLRNAFAVKERHAHRLKGAKVLLVDDVFTTGATTDACARVLKRAGGVEKVVVIAVARG